MRLGGTPIEAEPGWQGKGPFARALIDGDTAFTLSFQQALAAIEGPIVPLNYGDTCINPQTIDVYLVCHRGHIVQMVREFWLRRRRAWK